MFIQNSYRFGGATPIALLLDTYTGASKAYSLRKLKTGVTNVVRVRRSSDNTEQNFTPTEITDGTLTTFTGVNDGFVATWYDQSGNSNDATQSSASEQPQLVSSGVVNTDNGKPYILNQKTTLGLKYTGTTGLNGSNGTMFATYNSNNTGAHILLTQGSSVYLGTFQPSNTSRPDADSGTPTYYSNGVLITPTTRGALYSEYVVNQDVLSTTLNIDFGITGAWGNRIILYNYISKVMESSKGKEIIIYNTDQTTNQAGIESNINTYYSIY